MEQRFYALDDLSDAFRRYLPSAQKTSVSSDTSVMEPTSDMEFAFNNSAMSHADTYDAVSEHDGGKRQTDETDPAFEGEV